MTGPLMDAREEILARVERALSRSAPLFRGGNAAVAVTPGVPTAVTKAAGDKKALATQFGSNLVAISGSYEIVERETDVAASIVERARLWSTANETPIDRAKPDYLLSWDPAEFPIPDLQSQLGAAGVSLTVPDDLHDDQCRAKSAAITVGLTAVDAAFASTGSIVLASGTGRSRVASLLPSLHLAVVPMSRIHETFEAWLHALRTAGHVPDFWIRHRQIAFVTGPSKSADIELNLTLGVHGPREVHAIVFDDEP